MFTLFDRLIEEFLRNKFHAKRDKMIFKTLSRFQKDYPNVSTAQLNELKIKLEKEAVRVYTISDQSILEARVETASYNFWFELVQNTFSSLLLCFLTGSYYPLITPLIMIFGNWLKNIATIHKSYNNRIKGGMNSVISTYVDELKLNIDESYSLLNDNKQSSYYKMRTQHLINASQNLVPSSSEPLQSDSGCFSMSLTTFLSNKNRAKQYKDDIDLPVISASESRESYSPI
jgi:hypothetical protein